MSEETKLLLAPEYLRAESFSSFVCSCFLPLVPEALGCFLLTAFWDGVHVPFKARVALAVSGHRGGQAWALAGVSVWTRV